MWTIIAIIAAFIMLLALVLLVRGSMREYRRWRLKRDVYRALACGRWIGKDNRQ